MTYSKVSECLDLSLKNSLDLKEFENVVYGQKAISISDCSKNRLNETKLFVEHLLDNGIKVYGITTGFADLREKDIHPDQASELSMNLILSHDAGIGKPLDLDVVLGAMVICAHSLSKGYSGFRLESLNTLVSMINHRIIPIVPNTGSLGASGDLAFLSRLGNCMAGMEVLVHFNGKEVTAFEALKNASIKPFKPKAKEGLALINGTAFMASMSAISFIKQVHFYENLFALFGFFLPAVGATDAAFCGSIHNVRQQKGQKWVAEILRNVIAGSPFINYTGVQDDYCIRCLPQILGPKLEMLFESMPKIENEISAVTDNPLIFRCNEITTDVLLNRVIYFKENPWVVVSGGNFHGEYLSTYADIMRICNAKVALTLERQITYMLNPFRNKQKLPAYLIADEKKVGLYSGYMIAQYTANALVQKIAYLANPVSAFNLTSANESEDVVSYGATSCQKLLEQIDFLNQLIAIYLNVVVQAYSLARKNISDLSDDLFSEKMLKIVETAMKPCEFPIMNEAIFSERYALAQSLLNSFKLREYIGFPLFKKLYGQGSDVIPFNSYNHVESYLRKLSEINYGSYK